MIFANFNTISVLNTVSVFDYRSQIGRIGSSRDFCSCFGSDRATENDLCPPLTLDSSIFEFDINPIKSYWLFLIHLWPPLSFRPVFPSPYAVQCALVQRQLCCDNTRYSSFSVWLQYLVLLGHSWFLLVNFGKARRFENPPLRRCIVPDQISLKPYNRVGHLPVNVPFHWKFQVNRLSHFYLILLTYIRTKSSENITCHVRWYEARNEDGRISEVSLISTYIRMYRYTDLGLSYRNCRTRTALTE